MGYFIILITTILLLIRSVLFLGLNWQGALLVLLGLLLAFGFFQAKKKIESAPKLSILQALAIILVCSLGSLATYYLNLKGLGPFKASGLVGNSGGFNCSQICSLCLFCFFCCDVIFRYPTHNFSQHNSRLNCRNSIYIRYCQKFYEKHA